MKILKTKERSNLKKDSYQNLIEGAKIWAEYFRKNPHRFCTEYLGINLYPFQMILIYMMNICTTFAFIACRGKFLAPLYRNIQLKSRKIGED